MKGSKKAEELKKVLLIARRLVGVNARIQGLERERARLLAELTEVVRAGRRPRLPTKREGTLAGYILKAFEEKQQPMTVGEVAAHTMWPNTESVRQILMRLEKTGDVRKVRRGFWGPA